jgi:hypothetical protein
MRITVPDPLADQYADGAKVANMTAEEAMVRQLQRTVGVAPSGRQVVLGASQLEYLERRCGGGPITRADEVVARVARLASISFMGIDLLLSPGQLEELAFRASRQGKPMETLVKEIADRLVTDFFYSSGGGVAVAPKADASLVPSTPVAVRG